MEPLVDFEPAKDRPKGTSVTPGSDQDLSVGSQVAAAISHDDDDGDGNGNGQRKQERTPAMPAPALLATKLGVQARGGRHVARERLLTRLESAPAVRLVLVSAPAGFGKSTLLAEWLATANVRVGWLSLDPADNDVVRFSRYIVGAAARLSGSEEPFDAAQPFDPELAVAGVLDWLAGAGDAAAGPVVLVLDDYHVIHEPPIHQLVATLVERLPGGARLAIATRADPPLPLARLRARGELLEIRGEDLRFTPDEAAELLASAELDLDAAEVDELTTRTEGWAAALRLAAVSLRGRSNHAELVARFGASHRFVLDYIVEEVLAGLPGETQEFLLRTSILERLTGPLCDTVAGVRDSQAQLEELERANLLIVPLDDERRWYRYHALFAEVLRTRLGILHAEEVAGLHAAASAWYEEHGDDEEAIRHAMRSGDLERTSRVVSLATGRHINAGELNTVRRWLDALPPEVVRGHAQLSASYAWCHAILNETQGLGGRLADAERALADGRDGGSELRIGIPVQLALLRSQLAALEGDSATAIAQARLARELVPAELPVVAQANLRGMAGALLGTALRGAGDLEAATEAYEAGMPDLRAGGNQLAPGRVIADLVAIAIERGDATHAVQLCESELARGSGAASYGGAAAIWAALATARAELGQPALADAAARHGLELAVRAGDAPSARSAEATLARIAPMLEAGAGVSRERSHRESPGPVEALSARELDVLRLIALGRSNRQIAAELFVTVGTVKTHVHSISGKLGAVNRVQAVARGRESGLLR